MTEITKTNERDERKQIGDALTSLESSITTIQGDITTIEGDITTIEGNITTLDGRITALEGGVDGTPPTSLVGRKTTNGTLEVTINAPDGANTTTASSSTYNQWTTLLTATTSSGVIEFMNIWQSANAADLNWGARLTVDGTVVWTSDTDAWRLGAENTDGFYLIGTGGTSASSAGGAIAFTDSFLLEFRINENSAGTVTAGTAYNYRLT